MSKDTWTTLLMVVGVPLFFTLVIWSLLMYQGKRSGVRATPDSKPSFELLFKPGWLQSGTAALVFYLVYLAGIPVERYLHPEGALKTALTLAPLPFLGWLLFAFFREVRGGDEFVRRLHLDALTFAFPAFLFQMMGMWVQDRLMGPPQSKFDRAWAFACFFYWFGLFIGRMRYMPVTKPGDPPR